LRMPGFSRLPLAALLASAAGASLLALRGAEWQLWAGWGMVEAAALSRERDPWCLAACVALVLPQAGVGGTAASAAVALSAGMVAGSRGAGLAARTAALAGGLVVFLDGRAGGLSIWLAVLVVAAVLPRAGARRALLLAGMAAAPLVGGLPRPSPQQARVVQERYGEGATVWEGPVSVRVGEPELLLRCREPGTVYLDLGAGGVRDPGPVGLVVTDLMALPVASGRETLQVRQTSGWVMVTLERGYSPRTHPVVHLFGAWTGDRR